MLSELPQTAINAIGNPLAVKNQLGQVVKCNRAFLELLELTEKSILGRTAFEYLADDEADFHSLADQKSHTLGCDGYTYEAVLKRSITKLLEIYKAPLIRPSKAGAGLLVIVKRQELRGVEGLGLELALISKYYRRFASGGRDSSRS